MASNIVPGNIDGTYPVAGQDNSSQGFRDNFSAIKNNFTEAKSEIEALQSNKASLDASSNFNDNVVTRAVLKDTAMTVYDHTTVASGTVTLNHQNGHYQKVTLTGDIDLAFSNFPTSGTLGRFILEVTYSGTPRTITVTTATKLSTDISGVDGSSRQITPSTSGVYLYEIFSPDGGTNVYMHQLGTNYFSG
jgi:hypothetical protein